MSVKGRINQKLLWLKYNKYRKSLNAQNKNLRIFGPITIKEPEKIEIGNNCRFNDFAFLHGGGGIVIEDDVTLSASSKLISYGYDTRNWKDNYLLKDHVGQPIHIGKGAWIGAGAIILPGVKITGEGVIVAAGSVLNRNIEKDFVLVGGSPAKILKTY